MVAPPVQGTFDLVFLDGGTFASSLDLGRLMPLTTGWIVLDDTNPSRSIKNAANRERLRKTVTARIRDTLRGRQLNELTLGILGMGSIGREVARRGYHVAREYSVDPLALVRVRDVMDGEAPAVRGSMKLADLAAAIAKNERLYVRHQALPIVDEEGKLAGIITRGDIMRALQTNPGGEGTVLEAGTQNPVVASPDEPLSDAVATMAHYNVGRLPVVDKGQLVGYLGRASILTARQRLLEEEFQREPGLFTMRRNRLRDNV